MSKGENEGISWPTRGSAQPCPWPGLDLAHQLRSVIHPAVGLGCQNRTTQSVTAITFWSFFGSQSAIAVGRRVVPTRHVCAASHYSPDVLKLCCPYSINAIQAAAITRSFKHAPYRAARRLAAGVLLERIEGS